MFGTRERNFIKKPMRHIRIEESIHLLVYLKWIHTGILYKQVMSDNFI